MLSLLLAATVIAQEPPSFEVPARQLQAATVTVRVLSKGDADIAEPDAEPAKGEKNSPRITICSGVAIGGGYVVTSASATTGELIRITLAGGGQAKAKVRVVDEHSGLVLLETDPAPATSIELASELPKVGSWVVAAAAWGSEQPAVSFGIVSAHDRTFPGGGFPPLTQCDLRTAETSEGCGVVNTQGKLIGIVAATESTNRRGWTYLLPVQHVQRLLRARAEAKDAQPPASTDAVTVLKRVRPKIGMVLNPEGEAVVVSRIEPGSPAEKSGIRVGDVIVAAEGVQVRSVYQAVRPVLNKQPGDVVEFLVRQPDGTHKKEVVLGGGVELPAAHWERLSQIVRPKLMVEGLARDGIRARSSEGQIRELLGPRTVEANAPDGRREPPPDFSSEDKIKLLEDALEGYRSVILYYREQLKRREQERDDAQNLLKTLKAN